MLYTLNVIMLYVKYIQIFKKELKYLDEFRSHWEEVQVSEQKNAEIRAVLRFAWQ